MSPVPSHVLRKLFKLSSAISISPTKPSAKFGVKPLLTLSCILAIILFDSSLSSGSSLCNLSSHAVNPPFLPKFTTL